MNKKDLSEADIKEKFITPALTNAGWDEHTQLGREIFFTDGRIYVKGKITARGRRKFADYILFYKPNVPIAIIEAKDNNHSVKAGIQQALGYANTLASLLCLVVTGAVFISTTKQLQAETLKPRFQMTNSQVLNNFGRNTKNTKA